VTEKKVSKSHSNDQIQQMLCFHVKATFWITTPLKKTTGIKKGKVNPWCSLGWPTQNRDRPSLGLSPF